MNKTVHCYHEEFGNPDSAPLISLWERSWRYWGWETHILTSDWAVRHAKHTQLVERVSKWPTKATSVFTTANCKRYCAMAAIGGGVLCDLDIINYGFTPEVALQYSMKEYAVEIPTNLIIFDALAPTPAFGNQQAFESVVDYFLTLDESKYPDYCCEMLTMRDYSAKRIPIATEMTLGDWKNAFMVHYGNNRWNISYPGIMRSKGIPNMRPLTLAN